MEMKNKQGKEIDWTGVERDFRENRLSIRDVARWHGISEGYIRKKAKQCGWQRGVVIEDAEGTQARSLRSLPALPFGSFGCSVLEASPEMIVRSGRELAFRLLGELDAVTSRQGELEAIIDEATASDNSTQRRDAMLRAVNLPSRAMTLKALAQAAKTLAETLVPVEGKKAKAADDAKTAGSGSEWGDDLHRTGARAN